MTKSQAALNTARKHAAALAANLKDARDAHADGDDAAVRRCHRAALVNCDAMSSAHEELERSITDSGSGYKEPTAEMGAQVSNGQSPRSRDPETRRLQDQQASIDFCHRERMRQMSGRR